MHSIYYIFVIFTCIIWSHTAHLLARWSANSGLSRPTKWSEKIIQYQGCYFWNINWDRDWNCQDTDWLKANLCWRKFYKTLQNGKKSDTETKQPVTTLYNIFSKRTQKERKLTEISSIDGDETRKFVKVTFPFPGAPSWQCDNRKTEERKFCRSKRSIETPGNSRHIPGKLLMLSTLALQCGAPTF